MFNKPLRSKTSTIDIYIKLAQYPILQDTIRAEMRKMIFESGLVTEDKFEGEIKRLAIDSQKREGIHNPFDHEEPGIWQKRLDRIRNFHTDYYFAYNMPPAEFDNIVEEVLHGQPGEEQLEKSLKFNPELAPWELLFKQGQAYEKKTPQEQIEIKHHLEEIKVVLIRGMITDQLRLIAVAKKVLSVADLHSIYKRRIGEGKIGGKAAGMLIAWKILQQQDPEIGADISQSVSIPQSYYLGTNVMYDFRRANELDDSMNQKYKSHDDIRDDYARVVRVHLEGKMVGSIVEQLKLMLEAAGNTPMIVRSSSLLEDNFGSAFAGKYDSYFCPNQGTPEENIDQLLRSIKLIYASSLNPNALLYRQKHGLIDYDERMAILIQQVSGEKFGDYYMPAIAGVGFSQNPFRWNPKIRREEGFLRMVWGMGTRAVDRVASDYPRLISLSHPRLRPESSAKAIRQYSQHQVDVVDLKNNEFKTLPISEVLTTSYPYLRQIASVDAGGYLQEMVSAMDVNDVDDLVLTFDYLTKDAKFVRLMRTALMRLEKAYGTAVDIEFAVKIVSKYPYFDYDLNLLQCRPLSQRAEQSKITMPANIDPAEVLFTEHRFVPNGGVEGIRYLVFVDPKKYRLMPDQTMKLELGRAIGRINKKLEDDIFILLGPGRWGSANLDLGVRVGYADIYNTKVLIEIAAETAEGGRPELSYGTHFFQDLVEAGIYSLPLHLDSAESKFNWEFFRTSPNCLATLSPQDANLADYINVIDLAQVAANQRLTIVMDGVNDEAIGYLVTGNWADVNSLLDEPPLSNF